MKLTYLPINDAYISLIMAGKVNWFGSLRAFFLRYIRNFDMKEKNHLMVKSMSFLEFSLFCYVNSSERVCYTYIVIEEYKIEKQKHFLFHFTLKWNNLWS